MSVQNAVLAKAESVYDESLTMIVGLGNMNCSVGVILFSVSSSNGPLDTSEFASEPSFVSLTVSSGYGMTIVHITEDQNVTFSTEVQIFLNRTRLSSEQQGKLIADALKRKIEDLLNIFLIYDKVRSQIPSTSDVTHHYYISGVPVVEELRNIFQSQEFPGLSELFSSDLSIGNADVQLGLEKIGNSYRWSYRIIGGWGGILFQMSFDHEYTISLNEILSHVGVISSASTASASNIYIEVFTGNANWTFISLETVPEMSRTQDTSEQITFHADITNSSVDDIRLRFKIIESGNDLTTIYVAAAILGVLSCIIGFYFLRRRRVKSPEHRL
jgi:hypothetical protein